jgi:hypothetical protein
MSGPPLLIHGDVGPATGNVDHPGDVKVEGNVQKGGQVRAEGNVHITGHVTSATVVASGDLTVDGIVSGADSVLDAVGRITAFQVHDAKVLAGLDIEIGSSAERARLRAGKEILLRGVPGLLRGGVARAGHGLAAVRIEAAGTSPADLRLGGHVFEEDPAEMEERLAFTRKHTVQAKMTSSSSPDAYRRTLAGLRAYRKLARTLGHRMQRIRAVESSEDPVLEVIGDGPAHAVLRIGPEEQVVEAPPVGPFEFRAGMGEPEHRLEREAACEQ